MNKDNEFQGLENILTKYIFLPIFQLVFQESNIRTVSRTCTIIIVSREAILTKFQIRIIKVPKRISYEILTHYKDNINQDNHTPLVSIKF